MHRINTKTVLLLLAGLSASGCTTINAVGGGPDKGEFYFAAQRSFLGLTGPAYVVRCKEISDPIGTELVCQRVLVGLEAGALAPGASPSGRQKFVRSEKD